jgi:hypothetical protein
LLRTVAAPGWKVWCSKLAFGVTSTAALLVLLCLTAFKFSLGRTWNGDMQALWAGWGVLTLEFLGWGIFFSLLTRRPLNAACMAAVASLGTVLVMSWFGSPSVVATRGAYSFAVLHWILQIFLLFAIDAWIALRWVLDRAARHPVVKTESAGQTAVRLFVRRLAAASAAAFAAIMFIPAFVLNVIPWPWRFRTVWFSELSGVSLVEAIAWGTLFALRTRRTAVAALWAALAGFVCSLVLTICFAVATYRGHSLLDLQPWLNALPLRLIVAVSLLVVDVWLAVLRQPTAGIQGAEKQCVAPLKSVSPLRALLWQERRQGWRVMAVFWGLAISLLVFYRVSDSVRDYLSFSVAMAAAGALASLMGSCAFLAEQEGHHFRFFAERGTNPRQVWIAKQLVWFPAAMATAGTFCGVTILSLRSSSRLPDAGQLLGTWAMLPLIAYCCGQLTSMLIARGLVAGLMGLVLAALVFSWQLLMQHLGMGLWWSVAPIPILLLVATWLRVPGWLLERRGWRSWMPLVALLLVPFVGLPLSVASFRIYEIPDTGPGFAPEQVVRPVTRDQAETGAMYRQAIAALAMNHDQSRRPSDSPVSHAMQGWESVSPLERAWLEANRTSLEITLKAAQRPSCVFYDPTYLRIDSRLDELQAMHNLARLLLLEARRLESAAELDKALEHYLAAIRLSQHVTEQGNLSQFLTGNSIEALVCACMPRWAAHADQNPERIRHAIRRLEAVFQSAPALADSINIDFLMIRRAIETDFDALVLGTVSHETMVTRAALTTLMPWECARAVRLLNYRTQETLQYVAQVNAAVSRGQPPSSWSPAAQSGYDEKTRKDIWAETTVILSRVNADFCSGLIIHAEARRRALRMILALKGWQSRHGDLPPSQDIVVTEYFDRLPLDPWTAEPFGYAPRGFDRRVRLDASGFIEPGQALLWSQVRSGSTIRRVGSTEDGYPRFEVSDSGASSLHAASAGWSVVYPIP